MKKQMMTALAVSAMMTLAMPFASSLRPALVRPASVRETTVDTQLTPTPFLWSGRRADA